MKSLYDVSFIFGETKTENRFGGSKVYPIKIQVRERLQVLQVTQDNSKKCSHTSKTSGLKETYPCRIHMDYSLSWQGEIYVGVG